MSEDLRQDIFILLDGFNKEFGHSKKWNQMTKEQKEEWFDKFAREHAHPVSYDG